MWGYNQIITKTTGLKLICSGFYPVSWVLMNHTLTYCRTLTVSSRILHIPPVTHDLHVFNSTFHIPLLRSQINVSPPLSLGLHGVFIHVLWLLQEYIGGGPELLIQHPSGVPVHRCLLLLLLFNLYRGTVSPSFENYLTVWKSEITRKTEFSLLELYHWFVPGCSCAAWALQLEWLWQQEAALWVTTAWSCSPAGTTAPWERKLPGWSRRTSTIGYRSVAVGPRWRDVGLFVVIYSQYLFVYLEGLQVQLIHNTSIMQQTI